MRIRSSVGLLGVASLFALSACGDDDVLVEAYCNYRSVSEAQRDFCIGDVAPEQLKHSQSDAAIFARKVVNGDKVKCGYGAGPLCEDYVSRYYDSFDQDQPACSYATGDC